MDGPVLILGGGINGSAIARELVLRRIPVVVADTQDLAYGATSRSSRLIHGGLRYLEYAEFSLVRESLNERTRLLRLAPHLVRPLRIHTPVESRWSGWLQAIGRLLGFKIKNPQPRGLWLIKIGLWLYQKYAADPQARPVATNKVGQGESPKLNASLYRWVCSYDDGQVLFPERLVVEWLADAAYIAAEEQVDFQVLTHCRVQRDGETVTLTQENGPQSGQPISIIPRLIVNATGGWVDDTLKRLEVESERLMGGTKGSHLLVHNAALRDALAGDGVYAEAADGRPVFILPMNDLVLVGTTDIPFDDDPDQAIAQQAEVDYLLEAVAIVFPDVDATADDVVAHYAGVRPLPNSNASTPGAVTRRHFLQPHEETQPHVLSIIGGKLTTCRSLAEETADWVLEHHGQGAQIASTAKRPTLGGRDYPPSEQLAQSMDAIAGECGLPSKAVEAVWRLYGTRTESVLREVISYGASSRELIADELPLPLGLVRFVKVNEWAVTLEDIVERRLMLIFGVTIRRSWLVKIQQLCNPDETNSACQQAVDDCVKRLDTFYGRKVEDNGD